MSKLNPLDHTVCLKQPARLAPSTWIEHVPFAMYLIDLVRPRVFVELGTYYGVSYCAFCQAVKEQGLETHCAAVDTWRGDPQGGVFGEEVLEDLRQHHDPRYSDFSRLLQGDFSDALPLFEDGSVDLLHIDGFHTYDAAKSDYETWLPKVSPRGIVLFHDISVREKDFGVWRLWEELKKIYPGRHFEFEHGYGLGIVATGEEFPEALRPLFDATAEEAARIRDFFGRLGSLVATEQEAQTLRHRSAKLSAEVEGLYGSRAVRMAKLLSEGGAGAVVRRVWSKVAGGEKRLEATGEQRSGLSGARLAEKNGSALTGR